MATEYFNDAWRIPNNKNQSLVSNYSMEFDKATGENIDLGNENYLKLGAEDFTWSGWINPSSWGTSFDAIYVCAATNGVWIGSFGTNFVLRKVNVSNILSYPLPAINTWTHICITRNNGACVLYFNGISVDSATSTHDFTVSANVYLGAYGAAASLGFSGKIDQVSIFDYALPATGTNSVATLYGGGTAVTNPMSLSPTPVAYYQLGDQTASNDTTEPTPPVQSYLVPNNSLQDYVFDFNSDYISFANGSTMARQQKISYSAWVNTTSLTTTQYIVGNNSSSNKGTSIFLLNSASYPDRLVFQFGDLINFNNQSYLNSFVANLSSYVSANEWFHVAASWDGTTSKIYINGIERNSWTPSQPPTYTISDWLSFRIGRRGDSSTSSFFNGMLSNIAFWNSNLTPAQVTTLYNNGSPAADISSLSPISWWKLNAQDTFDGTNWTIKDYAGSNDGTSNGMTSANLVQSNLQHTSGYSPYALSLDSSNANSFTLDNGGGNGLLNAATSFTISAWVNPNQPASFGNIFTHFYGGVMFRFYSNGNIQLYATKENNTFPLTTAFNALTFTGNWQHVVGIYDGSFLKIYVDNVLVNTPLAFSDTLKNDTSSTPDIIGNRIATTQFFDGKMSNVAVWKNSVIDVNTLYNQGVPADLTSLNPSGWWQMGSNSSFDANTSKWTCLNEGTARTSTVPSNATTFAGNMTNDDIVNGVGYSANGLGTSSIEIVGDAPYSTANGISENMDVLDRTTDLPPTV